MKKLITVLLIIIPFYVNAGEVGVKLLQRSYITDSEAYQRGVGTGIQLEYTPKKSFYVFGSTESTRVSPGGEAYKLTSNTIGIGTRFKIGNNWRGFIQGGYSQNKSSWNKRQYGFNEGVWQFMNTYFGHFTDDPINFESYEIGVSDSYVMEFGAEYQVELAKNLDLNIGASYQFKRIKEELIAFKDSWNYEETGGRWERSLDRDYGSISFSIGLGYRF